MKRSVILLFVLLFSMPFVASQTITFSDLFEMGRSFINIPPGQLFQKGNGVSEPDPSSNPDSEGVTTYFYSGTKLIASRSDEVFIYNYQDRLGSDINGKQLPFGQELIDSENRFEFTGKELDSDLYYFGARYYDPSVGKFTSVDPIRSNHAYNYVMNDPLNLVDPTGMDEWTPDISLPSSAPIGVIPYNDYPVAEQDSLIYYMEPDSVFTGGTIILGQPGAQTQWWWESPTEGSPVNHYVVQIRFCIDCETEPNQVVVQIRAAGVDAGSRQGGWSQRSDPWPLSLPPPPQGMAYGFDDSTGSLVEIDDDVGIDDPPGDDPDPEEIILRAGFSAGNYPNPFNQFTTLRYNIPEGAWSASDINIYNARGQLIHTIPTIKRVGEHEAVFDIRDVQTNLASGVYFALMTVNEMPSPLKMVLDK